MTSPAFDGPGVIPHIEEGFTGCKILPRVMLKPSGEGVADGLTQAEGAEGTADPFPEPPAGQSWQSTKSDQPTHNEGRVAMQQTGSSSGHREVSES